ncbi:flagellar hook basal-body protein [Sphingopyxis sp. XHP0097]|jgi:flagellar hook protein FlgE|uniref:Flagellar hook protein FlgE n=1 Tax=Sphingopyxis jiangsuensis TaxID=2871171 RepID=A0ABS7ME75_9SPHN|nr:MULTISPECIES: flagellar hook basal-body protein [Sphingopyxis]MBL0769613.1 flagellar hook basal-body protein [Sphingopyxis lutea]MBY4637258.1 flagellar hook basal-body protein [Sphingopyxis jiangsuensis]
MSFYTSLSGLKAAQTDMSVISNNISNAGSIGFKRSKAQFGDIFASSPTQSTKMIAGQGTRLNGITQQFTQGSYESSEKTLDMAIVGEGMFVVRGEPPREQVAYTRNGSFTKRPDNQVVDSTGAKLQLLPVDANGNVTDNTLAGAFDFVIPAASPSDPTAELVNVSIGLDGLVTATFTDGSDTILGKIAMATFPAMEGLRPVGDAHWQSTGESGPPTIDAATNGPMGAIRSGALERSNVDITEELVMLIGAQRNFQANAKAIEGASQISQTIINMR